MINDQAAALRQLKKKIDSSEKDPPQSREEFLETIRRPAGFTSVIMILPSQMEADFPPLQNWVGNLISSHHSSLIWDQSGLMSVGLLNSFEEGYNTPEGIDLPAARHLESSLGPLRIIPRFQEFKSLLHQPQERRIRFTRSLIRQVGTIDQLWVTVNSSELGASQSILHAADLACILVPDREDSVIKSYEAVKSIHLSGYFSPIGLLSFASESPTNIESVVSRIKSVAKHFLSLDLVGAGMVLSDNTYIPPFSKPDLKSRIDSLEDSSRDFMYFFAERLLYPMPGDLRP
jgi:hypothetical protein